MAPRYPGGSAGYTDATLTGPLQAIVPRGVRGRHGGPAGVARFEKVEAVGADTLRRDKGCDAGALSKRMPCGSAADSLQLPVFADDADAPRNPWCPHLFPLVGKGAIDGRKGAILVGALFRLPRSTFLLLVAGLAAPKAGDVFALEGIAVVDAAAVDGAQDVSLRRRDVEQLA